MPCSDRTGFGVMGDCWLANSVPFCFLNPCRLLPIGPSSGGRRSQPLAFLAVRIQVCVCETSRYDIQIKRGLRAVNSCTLQSFNVCSIMHHVSAVTKGHDRAL
jgi:hypothetical protein